MVFTGRHHKRKEHMNQPLTKILVACMLTSAALAQEAVTEKPQWFDWGGDLRIREEAFNDIPIIADPPGITRGGENNYFRIRSRIWGSATWEQATVYGQLASEFRHFLEPDAPSSWDWPDEAVVDQLYVNIKGLMLNSNESNFCQVF